MGKIDFQKWFDRYSPDTKEAWHDRLLLRNTGGADYSLVKNKSTGTEIFLPKALAVENTCYCPGCAKPLKGTKPQIWFGDWFCGHCYEQFSGRSPK